MSHKPVMIKEFLEYFEDVHIETFFDGTLGAGGHAKALLEAHPEIKTYIGCDRDESSFELSKEKLAPWEDKITYVHGNFSDLDKHLKKLGVKKVDGFFLTWGYRPCN